MISAFVGKIKILTLNTGLSVDPVYFVEKEII